MKLVLCADSARDRWSATLLTSKGFAGSHLTGMVRIGIGLNCGRQLGFIIGRPSISCCVYESVVVSIHVQVDFFCRKSSLPLHPSPHLLGVCRGHQLAALSVSEGGDVRSLADAPSNPSRILLGTSAGQMFQSEDGGSSWKTVRSTSRCGDDYVLDQHYL